ncbi:MAG: glycosyltransferase 87 family protein [Planctomycetota bacterium]
MGQETNFLAALLLGTLWLFLADKRGLAGVALGLACLTRYDAVLFAAGLVLLEAVRRRRIPWTAIGAAALVVLPWLAVAGGTLEAHYPSDRERDARHRARHQRGPRARGVAAPLPEGVLRR